jgi:hypothetical protein
MSGEIAIEKQGLALEKQAFDPIKAEFKAVLDKAIAAAGSMRQLSHLIGGWNGRVREAVNSGRYYLLVLAGHKHIPEFKPYLDWALKERYRYRTKAYGGTPAANLAELEYKDEPEVVDLNTLMPVIHKQPNGWWTHW